MKKTLLDWVHSWIEKANRDLKAAKSLHRKKNLSDIASYHAQQAGEKYLKAYLVWLEIQFPKTHRIEELVNLASSKDPKIIENEVEWVFLTPFAVESRYPTFGEIPRETSKKTKKIAKEIREYVLSKLPTKGRKRKLR